jgi:hypothetical protein
MCLVTPKFMPVHIHYITNDYSLSMPFIVILKIIVLSMLLTAFSHIYSLNLALPPTSVLFLSLVSPFAFNPVHEST